MYKTKRISKKIKTAMYILLLILCAKSVYSEEQKSSPENFVYVTRTGKKYHRKSCSYLRKSSIPINQEKAKAAGYTPCSKCRPAILANTSQKQEKSASESTPNSLYKVNKENISVSSNADITKMLKAKVIDHVDGDTVRINITNPPNELQEIETIRFLGIDTPETVHPSKPVEYFGKEASSFTRSNLLGKTVYLAFDYNLRDRYKRLLAYIYTEDGKCFNAVLVSEGYAHAYVKYPFQFIDEFTQLEKNAKARKKGLWGEN